MHVPPSIGANQQLSKIKAGKSRLRPDQGETGGRGIHVYILQRTQNLSNNVARMIKLAVMARKGYDLEHKTVQHFCKKG